MKNMWIIPIIANIMPILAILFYILNGLAEFNAHTMLLLSVNAVCVIISVYKMMHTELKTSQ